MCSVAIDSFVLVVQTDNTQKFNYDCVNFFAISCSAGMYSKFKSA